MGKLIIYTGPMKSGKTTKLLNEYRKVLKENKKAYLFKPKLDTRWSSVRVQDRNGNTELCTLLDDIDMLWYFKDMYKYFFIDEFQFLEGNMNIIRQLLDINKNIYVSGLNLTAEKKPFGKMGELMCLADKIYFLKGNCDICGKQNKGIYTLYNGSKSNDIELGDEQYKCVCNKCYKLSLQNLKNML